MSFVFVYTFILKGDLGRRDVSVETEAPPTEAPKQPAPPPPSVPGVWEESEAKLRERLIERTKKLRVAVTDKILILPDTEPPAQVYTLYIIHIHCISSIYTVYTPYTLYIIHIHCISSVYTPYTLYIIHIHCIYSIYTGFGTGVQWKR